ncbi:MAG: DUF3788 family protein [Ruminiclostridium sp.]|nr:DUF3788 family protein [Ruminiclostridium sp.]
MQWKEKFPPDKQPSMEEIAKYIGGETKELWKSLMSYMLTAYKAKLKLSYSCKFQHCRKTCKNILTSPSLLCNNIPKQ